MLDTPRNPCQARPAAGFDRANQLVPEVPVSRENSNLPTFIESGLTRSAQRVWQAPAGCGPVPTTAPSGGVHSSTATDDPLAPLTRGPGPALARFSH
jgi:hypothetical protein